MAPRTLLPILLLCMLLQVHGGPYRRNRRTSGIKVCEQKPSIRLCTQHCSYFQNCPANRVCCSTFCGNVCLRLL
ncbi:PREDICTED: protein WFDC10B [Chrysochloris asiatica]|uniref:Protein WFDC10B n=1 Tax=Chrysochloris asiatica TaxID=185453 RepID=A0A9B0TD66_CHRAS|nr:PREDICTED: protein WFDC10B [Chrysochloris asiatica]